MKNNISLVKHATRSLTAIALLLFSTVSFSQNETLNLGMLTSFEAYTVAGAVANSGGAVTGDIGTGFGIISGFSDPPSTGNHYTANAATKQAQYDLLRLYIHLNALPVNFPDPFVPASTAHSPVFGVGEVLAPGVYSIGGAGSISGALTLDGGGDPDAVFVIKMNGAMTVDAGATVSLAPGTKSANVFWLINGAISVAAGADIKGTLFSKSGAVGLGANVSLEGRMLTMGGAITFGIGSTAILPPDATTIPIYCEADCTPAAAANILGVLSDFALFASAGAVGNTGITGINGLIGAHAGSIAGYTPGGTHIGTEEIANLLTAQAAADLDDAYIALMAMTPTVAHAATFLNETLAPGVYNIPTAGSLGGTVILDAGGDPDAIFVFKFAGAFNVAALSKIILANGAKRCNVFWLGGAGVATGAVNIGAFSEVSGYFIANNAASNSGNGVFLAGGQFSNSGAVNTNTAVIYDNPECIDSPILTPDPACGLVKTASIGGTGTGLLGEVITYTFEVTNIGPQTLTNVAVTDDMPGLVITGSPIANLASGEVKTITGTYTITQADNDTGSVTNSALARDANAVMDISGTATDNDDPTITTVTQSPGIALVKTASIGGTGTGLLGEVIAYTFAVTNTGPTVLTNIAVTDPMVGLVITGSPISALGVGTATSTAITGTYTITQADIDAGGVTNTATATDENGVTDISGTAIDNDAPTVTTVSHSPSVALVKTASIGGTGTGLLGEVITYTFPVTNTGSTTLTNIVVADPMLGLVISGSPIVTLAPGASSSAITGTYTITQADINAGSVTNTATATDANGVTDISGTAIDNDDPTVTATPLGAVAVVKTASIGGTGAGLLGEVITYTFAITNTGPTVLTNIAVTDPMVGLVITGSPIATLAQGAFSSAITGTYTITQADIDAGSVTNTATAMDENGVTDISGTAIDNDDPTLTPTPIGAVAVVKIASIGGTGAGLLGEVITYTFVITNTGPTVLTNIAVTDPMVGLVITGSPIATLAQGASSSAITGTYTITQADIDAGSVTNTATAMDENGVTDISGTAIDNDDPTVTLTPTFGLPDFTPTIDIDELVFITGGPAIDFVVTIAEINNGPSDGLIVFNIIKPTAFEITFAANTVNSVVNGNTAVNNADWDLVDNGTSIQATLKPGLSIGQNGVSSIGFSIVRGAGIPAETVQAITVTLVNGSGADSSTNDNTYHVNVKAQ